MRKTGITNILVNAAFIAFTLLADGLREAIRCLTVAQATGQEEQ